MIDTSFNLNMASDNSNQLVIEMINVLKDKRLEHLNTPEKKVSLRSFAAEHNLDPSMISRAEDSDPDKRRIPSLNFWFDWVKALSTTLPEIIEEAETRLNKSNS